MIWYGKSSTFAKDKILLKKNVVIKYDNISVITAYYINFVDSTKHRRIILSTQTFDCIKFLSPTQGSINLWGKPIGELHDDEEIITVRMTLLLKPAFTYCT